MSDIASVNDTERAVLAAALREPEIREMLCATATADWFNAIPHRTLFGAMQKLAMLGQPIDAPALLRAAREGRASVFDVPLDPEWLRESWALATTVTAESLEKSHLPELRKAFQVRSIQVLSSELLERSERFDPSSVLAWLQGKADAIGEAQALSKPWTDADLLGSIRNAAGEESGPLTGIGDLDYVRFRLAPKKITIVAARPSMGKSSISKQFAIAAAMQGVATAFFALEEGQEGWKETRIQMLTGEPYENFVTGKASSRSMRIYAAYYSATYDTKLFVYDNNEPHTAYDIVAKLRLLKRQEPTLGVVIIDQMQQIAGWFDNARGEGRDMAPTRIITEIVRGCRALNLHAVLVQQLNRDLEKGGKRREPVMADLGDTSFFERVADNVIFISRPNFEVSEDQEQLPDDVAVVKFGKRRRGQRSWHRMHWDGPRTIVGRWSDPILSKVEQEIDGVSERTWFGDAS